ARNLVRAVVADEPLIEIVGLADVEVAGWILQNVNLVRHEGKNGSRGRIRTYDQSVNSRPLYH
ncbi:MAG: hypothetical protein QOI22_692, partial [Verrucomicrobiota bacterium]